MSKNVMFIGGPRHGQFEAMQEPLRERYDVPILERLDWSLTWEDPSKPVETKIVHYILSHVAAVDPNGETVSVPVYICKVDSEEASRKKKIENIRKLSNDPDLTPVARGALKAELEVIEGRFKLDSEHNLSKNS